MESKNPLDQPIHNGRTLREIFEEKRRSGQFKPLRGEAKWQALKAAAERAARGKNEPLPNAETPEK